MMLSWPRLGIFVASFLPMYVSAALIDRGNNMVYDTELDITWLADANYAMTSGYSADGLMTWGQSMDWVGQLSFAGYSDWRLPENRIQVDTTCNHNAMQSIGYYCTASEMGHLFNVDMGLSNGLMNPNPDSDRTLFSNLQPGEYWAGSPSIMESSWSAYFDVNTGYQGTMLNGTYLYALAVHNGDISAVPVPAAIWLFGSGLLGLIGLIRPKT